LVIFTSSFPLRLFSFSLRQGAVTPLSQARFFIAPARFAAPRENRSPQAKIAGCARSPLEDFSPAASEHTGNANVRADFFQRKEKIEEFFDAQQESRSKISCSKLELRLDGRCDSKQERVAGSER
jgi:hypothetical protein